MRKRYPRREYAQQVLRRYRNWTSEELDRHASLLAGRIAIISAILESRGDMYSTFLSPAVKRTLERMMEYYLPLEAYDE